MIEKLQIPSFAEASILFPNTAVVIVMWSLYSKIPSEWQLQGYRGAGLVEIQDTWCVFQKFLMKFN